MILEETMKNIDNNGNVLFLDNDRLERKRMPFKRFENYKKGTGAFDFVKEHFSARTWNWWFVKILFNIINRCAPWLKKDDFKCNLFKQIMQFDSNDKNSSGVVMPLNVDLTETAEKVVVPMDLVKKALKNASYIAGVKTCLCRDSKGCKDYPHDIACMFIGEGARSIVRHGIATEFTYEQAIERLEKAADVGLVAQSLWVEIEQLVWGFQNNEMDKFLEICFCCPCCCVAMELSRNATPELRKRFHPVGWTAVVDEESCVGCGKCVADTKCVQDALRIGANGKLEINQEVCVGCGICKTKCSQNAIKIKQTMPMRDSIQEYFLEDFNIALKL